jgi:hypothetical protein
MYKRMVKSHFWLLKYSLFHLQPSSTISPPPSFSPAMIDLDKAIPYQPLVPLPPRPFQHAECISPSSKEIPSLTHPLPQRPIPQTAPPEHPSQSHQAQQDTIPPSPSKPSVSPNVNFFDSELAALNTTRVRDIALQDRYPHSEERQPQVGAGDTSKQGCVGSHNGE